MRISQEDVIFAKGLGVALDAPEDAEAEISRRLEAVSLDREEWRKAFLKMGASREKWRKALDDHVWRAAPADHCRCLRWAWNMGGVLGQRRNG